MVWLLFLFRQDFPAPFGAPKNIRKSAKSSVLFSRWHHSAQRLSPYGAHPGRAHTSAEVLGFIRPDVTAVLLRYRSMQAGQDVVACALWTCSLMFPSGVSLCDLLIIHSCLPCPFCLVFPAARVCDNALLRCQNGGTCHHHQRCHCPPGFTGILCERAHCQGSGECDDQLSGQASFNHPPVIRWLARNLVMIPLLIVFLCWRITDGLPS